MNIDKRKKELLNWINKNSNETFVQNATNNNIICLDALHTLHKFNKEYTVSSYIIFIPKTSLIQVYSSTNIKVNKDNELKILRTLNNCNNTYNDMYTFLQKNLHVVHNARAWDKNEEIYNYTHSTRHLLDNLLTDIISESEIITIKI